MLGSFLDCIRTILFFYWMILQDRQICHSNCSNTIFNHWTKWGLDFDHKRILRMWIYLGTLQLVDICGVFGVLWSLEKSRGQLLRPLVLLWQEGCMHRGFFCWAPVRARFIIICYTANGCGTFTSVWIHSIYLFWLTVLHLLWD